jgi:hypothetical protein
MEPKRRPLAGLLIGSGVALAAAIALVVPSQHRPLVFVGCGALGVIGASSVVLWGRKPSESTQQSIEKIKQGLLTKAEEETGLDFPDPSRYAPKSFDAVATELPQGAQPQQVQQAPFNSFPTPAPEPTPTPLPKIQLNDPWLQQGQQDDGLTGGDDVAADLFS